MIKWKFNNQYNLSDKNFAKIYSFFVIESPVKGVSVRGTSFDELKISKNSLASQIKKRLPSLSDNWKACTKGEIEYVIKDKGIFESVSLPLEVAIHIKRDDSKVDGLYYAIRCALAKFLLSRPQWAEARRKV